jgi:(1->4)-alpha-D-glucan 1-alpha-D-glucosylmutase
VARCRRARRGADREAGASAVAAALRGLEPPALDQVDAAVARMNADAAALDRLLSPQPFRLAYWRLAAERGSYRRFFDVNEVGSLRVERPEVFEAVHALLLRLRGNGLVDGVRVDHVDGLHDPRADLARLRAAVGDAWLVVEKVLIGDERLARRLDQALDALPGAGVRGAPAGPPGRGRRRPAGRPGVGRHGRRRRARRPFRDALVPGATVAAEAGRLPLARVFATLPASLLVPNGAA